MQTAFPLQVRAMQLTSRTTTALLEDLLNPAAQEVWEALDARFRPIIRGFSLKLGLGEADADDVTQETLTRVVKYYRQGSYDRSRGRLSSWVIGIARNCILDWQGAASRRRERRGESALVQLSDHETLNGIWDEECRRVILENAMRELREETRLEAKTIRAFEMIAFEERSASDVSAELGLSLDSVYAAKNRCLTQLREIMSRLTDVYELV
ncbi:MAG TPA: sigma-70 family RNA polymerase sigma factor [Phycisphaerae bacterium]|nr:sigma-70 family RNA polymerase sigma factor [Phycisphaerae bacterium]